MAILKFRVGQAVLISFGSPLVEFIRGSNSTKNIGLNYTDGTGQQLTNGQVLYTYLSPGVDGYVNITSTGNYTLAGAGSISVSVSHRPSLSQANQNVSFSLLGQPVIFQFVYNSKPIISDIIIDTPNRTEYIFDISDFTAHYSDFDNDNIKDVAIFGDVTGYMINGNSYNAGNWIAKNDIVAGLFKYVPLNQNAAYEKDNTWKVRDINGNESI